MIKLTKTLIATLAFAVVATSAFSDAASDFKSGMAWVYGGPGKMTSMGMASTDKNYQAMMKNATKVPENTVFFMEGNQLYMAYGMLDSNGIYSRH